MAVVLLGLVIIDTIYFVLCVSMFGFFILSSLPLLLQAGLRNDDDLLQLAGSCGADGFKTFTCCPPPDDLGEVTVFLKQATGIKALVKRCRPSPVNI